MKKAEQLLRYREENERQGLTGTATAALLEGV
jgi:hypothetical protein